MNLPDRCDFINFHDHGSAPMAGVFSIDNIMVHEGRRPGIEDGISYSVGAHPWFLDKDKLNVQMAAVRAMAEGSNISAIGETGLDKVKGADQELQNLAFIKHFELAEEFQKPLIIHCVKAWPEILEFKKELKPTTPWVIHGFKGKKELAQQLCDKGLYLSAWVEWAIRPVSSETLRSMPPERLFLETDGFDIGIEPVYKVVAAYLGIEIEKLKTQVYNNYMSVIKFKT